MLRSWSWSLFSRANWPGRDNLRNWESVVDEAMGLIISAVGGFYMIERIHLLVDKGLKRLNDIVSGV